MRQIQTQKQKKLQKQKQKQKPKPKAKAKSKSQSQKQKQKQKAKPKAKAKSKAKVKSQQHNCKPKAAKCEWQAKWRAKNGEPKRRAKNGQLGMSGHQNRARRRTLFVTDLASVRKLRCPSSHPRQSYSRLGHSDELIPQPRTFRNTRSTISILPGTPDRRFRLFFPSPHTAVLATSSTLRATSRASGLRIHWLPGLQAPDGPRRNGRSLRRSAAALVAGTACETMSVNRYSMHCTHRTHFSEFCRGGCPPRKLHHAIFLINLYEI